MARQRAEARLGVVLLVAGFVCQAVYYFFPHTAILETSTERIIALLLALIPVAVAVIGMKLYVPRSEHRTFAEVERGEERVSKHAGRLARLGSRSSRCGEAATKAVTWLWVTLLVIFVGIPAVSSLALQVWALIFVPIFEWKDHPSKRRACSARA
jgi:uncharacterized membrane protein